MTRKKKFGVSEVLFGGNGRTSSTASGRFSAAAVCRNAASTTLASEGDAAVATMTVGAFEARHVGSGELARGDQTAVLARRSPVARPQSRSWV